ncbi:flavin reductase [Nakamurella silvestris]|nr:flavin reductase [Nakamurella silvestris]
MKTALGNFGSGVTVVTAVGPDGPLGFTCQSFVSLSLEPALVSFCPARTSRTWPKIREIGRFCINVLAHDQEALSIRFASSQADKFEGLTYGALPSGAPLLHGVVAWVDGELADEYDGGDHTIVVASVRDLGTPADKQPLIYHRGDYLRS